MSYRVACYLILERNINKPQKLEDALGETGESRDTWDTGGTGDTVAAGDTGQTV